MDRSSGIQLDESTKLMRKVANGSVEAFDCLYFKFCPILRRLFASWDGHYTSSDDFIQKIFTRLWEQRKNFRGESSFPTYLFSIARHTLNEEIRRSCKIAKIDLKEHPGFGRDSHNGLSQPEAEFYLKELTVTFEEAKSRLTVGQRQALEVFHSAGVPFGEASKILGCSPKALECRLHRARKRVRELLAPVLKEK